MSDSTAGQKTEKAARLFELERDILNRREQLAANIKEYDKLLVEVRSFIPPIKPGPKPKPAKAQRKPRAKKAVEIKGNGPVVNAEVIPRLDDEL